MNNKIKEIVDQAIFKIHEEVDKSTRSEEKYHKVLLALAKIKHDKTAEFGYKIYKDIYYEVYNILETECGNRELDSAIYDIGYLLNSRHGVYRKDVSLDAEQESEEVYTHLVGISEFYETHE